MKLTYTVTIGEAVEQHVFEGDAGEVITAYNELLDCEEFGSDDEPEPCSLTGRSCGTCKHQGPCYGCGVHLANYEPASQQETHLEESNSTRRCIECGDMTKFRIVGSDNYFCPVCVPRSEWLTVWRDSYFNEAEKPEPPEQNCNTCRHISKPLLKDPCLACVAREVKPYSGWEPVPPIKAGDFVRVKEGIDKEKYENGLGWSPYMGDMVGKIYPVDDVRHQDNRVYLKARKERSYVFCLDDVELVARDCSTCKYGNKPRCQPVCLTCTAESADEPYSKWEPATRCDDGSELVSGEGEGLSEPIRRAGPPRDVDDRPKHPGEPSEVLRVMMEAKGWGVNDLEAKTGIVAGYWQDIVDGKVHINKHDARRLSRAFGVPLDYWQPSWVFADGGYVEQETRPQDDSPKHPGERDIKNCFSCKNHNLPSEFPPCQTCFTVISHPLWEPK